METNISSKIGGGELKGRRHIFLHEGWDFKCAQQNYIIYINYCNN